MFTIVPAVPHRDRRELGAPDDGGQVHADDLLQALVVELEDRGQRPRARDGRVVDEHVDPPAARSGSRRPLRGTRPGAQIGAHRLRDPAGVRISATVPDAFSAVRW